VAHFTAMDEYTKRAVAHLDGWYVQHLPHGFMLDRLCTLALELACLDGISASALADCMFFHCDTVADSNHPDGNYTFLNYLVLSMVCCYWMIVCSNLCRRGGRHGRSGDIRGRGCIQATRQALDKTLLRNGVQ